MGTPREWSIVRFETPLAEYRRWDTRATKDGFLRVEDWLRWLANGRTGGVLVYTDHSSPELQGSRIGRA